MRRQDYSGADRPRSAACREHERHLRVRTVYDLAAWEFEYYQDGATIFELPIFPDRIATMLRRGASTGAWPRYVKVSGIMAYDLLEIELRTSKIPVPSMVIVR